MIRKLARAALVILLLMTACSSTGDMEREIEEVFESQSSIENEDNTSLPDDAPLLSGYYAVGELGRPDTRELGGALLLNGTPNGEVWSEANWDLDTLCIYHELDQNFTVMGGADEWAYLPRPFYSCILRKDTGETAYCVFYYEEDKPCVLQVVETPESFDLRDHLERILSGLSERGVDLSTAAAIRGHCYETENGGTCEGILLLCSPSDRLRLFYNFEEITYRGVTYPPFNIIEQIP